jgi:lipopolysaccharide export system protein LptA
MTFLLMLCSFPAASDEAVDVTADSLHIDRDRRMATFAGHVTARFESLQFFCAAMTVTYSEAGALTSLQATGGVTVKRKDATAKAAAAIYNAEQGVLILKGNPVLETDGNRLLGDTIEVNLRTGRIDVAKARGTFILNSRGVP